MAKGTITCPACGVEEPVHATSPGAGSIALHDVGEFRCDACSARVVYGRLMPRVVVEPTRGERDLMWIRIRRQDPRTKEDVGEPLDLDPKMAFEFAKAVIGLVRI